MKIPEHYLPVMPYLILGDAAAFLQFTKNVFGATELHITRDDNDNIRHCEINIGQAVIMFGQMTETWAAKPAGMFIYVENVDRVYDAGLREKAISLMPPSKQDYGYTAGFEDLFGNHWWIVQGE
jgi:PhnB protein